MPDMFRSCSGQSYFTRKRNANAPDWGICLSDDLHRACPWWRAEDKAGRMRRFELDYRLAGDLQCRSETCTLTRLRMPALVPGRYVLLGPRRAAAPVDIGALRHSGDAACPLGDVERDFDYLTLRVEAIA